MHGDLRGRCSGSHFRQNCPFKIIVEVFLYSCVFGHLAFRFLESPLPLAHIEGKRGLDKARSHACGICVFSVHSAHACGPII